MPGHNSFDLSAAGSFGFGSSGNQFGTGGSGQFNDLSGRATDNLVGFGEGASGANNEIGIFGEGGIASTAFGGLKTLGSIWNSFQQLKLAKSSLKFQKKAFQTNLDNSTKVYNTALEDRIRTRFATEGRSGEADAKIAANRL